ncbi:MAG: hypothetical protein ACK6DA_09810, partial [Candidatus Kapaibacterium sp.]
GGQFNVVDQGGTGGRVSFIGGGHRNQMFGDTSFIGGGSRNVVNLTSLYGFIGGGMLNSILNNDSSTIGGGALNRILAESDASTIGGGMNNTIQTTSLVGFIGGGRGNTITDVDSATIGGGAMNLITTDADASTIGGGMNNTIQTTSLVGFIGGGRGNTITNSDSATIGGGAMNLITAESDASTIGGGMLNTVTTSSRASTIGGGRANKADSANYAGIASGHSNTIQTNADYNFIGGGNSNTVTNTDSATIGGGAMNLITTDADASTIGGGNNNTINSTSRSSTIGGGHTNTIGNGSFSVTISGGNSTDIGNTANYATIGGGNNNNIGSFSNGATISGGITNNISTTALNSTIGGGINNNIGTTTDATVGGGNDNNIADGGNYATISGGRSNDIGTATDATIGGGNNNNIVNGGTNSAILGGTLNDIGTAAGATNSVIGGGNNNNIADGANFGAILGGADHDINGGTHNLIGGGFDNNITTGNYNAILGGQGNTVVSGNHSAVLGGINNSVTGDLSFALGTGNTAANNGFALGNGSTADANEYYAKYSAGFVMEGAGTANQNFIATFINPNNGNSNSNGIAIQLANPAPGVTNHFVEFRSAGGTVVGRIEGQLDPDLDQLSDAAPNGDSEHIKTLDLYDYLIENAQGDVDGAKVGLDFAIADAVFAGLDLGQVIAEVAGLSSCAAATLGACTGAQIAKSLDIVTKAAVLASAIAAAVIAAQDLQGSKEALEDMKQLKCDYITMMKVNNGVSYESGAADYAEWLPKLNPAEKFAPTDIVAVKAGKITKNTADADQFMVISTKPIVLGNMPAAGENKKDYEKVAFMGQVPVRVLGKVHKGDYILPSGGNNGFGIAVSPNNMKTEDFKKIVGVAWSESKENQNINLINVAVGLNTNSLASVIERQAKQILQLQQAMSYTQEYIKKSDEQMNAISATLSQMVPGFEATIKAKGVELKNNPVRDFRFDFSPTDMTKNVVAPVENIPTVTSLPKVFFDNQDIRNGFRKVEQDLKNRGVDIHSNPYFQKVFVDPEYKNSVMNSLLERMNNAAMEMPLKENSEVKQ